MAACMNNHGALNSEKIVKLLKRFLAGIRRCVCTIRMIGEFIARPENMTVRVA